MIEIIPTLLDRIQERACQARPTDIRIGAYWTYVAVELVGRMSAGLSSTLGGGSYETHRRGHMPIPDAGRLLDYDAFALASLAAGDDLLSASVGFATINALLDIDESLCTEVNAADVIAERGHGAKVAVIGHFPFISKLKKIADELWVLELQPGEGDLPADAAADVIPQADVVALTGTSLLNRTFDGLMRLCRQDAFVVVLGATTPLSPVLFDVGVDAISGTRVIDPARAALAVSQGATFRQIPGKRLLTMFRS